MRRLNEQRKYSGSSMKCENCDKKVDGRIYSDKLDMSVCDECFDKLYAKDLKQNKKVRKKIEITGGWERCPLCKEKVEFGKVEKHIKYEHPIQQIK